MSSIASAGCTAAAMRPKSSSYSSRLSPSTSGGRSSPDVAVNLAAPLDLVIGLSKGFSFTHDYLHSSKPKRAALRRHNIDKALETEMSEESTQRWKESTGLRCSLARCTAALSSASPPSVDWTSRAPPGGVTYQASAYAGEPYTYFLDVRGSCDVRLRRRTPGPPPFSLMNSTPFDSSVIRIFSQVCRRPPSGPSTASSRLIVGLERPALSANSSCDHPRRARAALI